MSNTAVTATTERFLKACRREAVDRTPVWFMRQAGRSQPQYRALREQYSLPEIVRHPELGAEVTLRPVAELGVDAAVLFADIMLPLQSMGVAFELLDGGPSIARPVRTTEDLERLRPFELDDTTAAVLQTIRLIRSSSPVPLIGFSGAPFTLASYVIEGGASRDYLVTKAVMHQDPVVWARLMELLTDMVIRYLGAQVAAGVQAVQLFDSWVGCLGATDYAQHVAPYSRAIAAALRPAGTPMIHFGTCTAGLLPEMAAAGGEVIGVDWRIPLAEAWARIGYDRGIQGNLDPAVLLAPRDIVRRRTLEILRQAPGRPGHIFNLGHGVLPQTPREHLRFVVEIVHEFEVGDRERMG
ncbi:MAG: uroporphyrinogen decarboxylase [Bacillati bacterium ANGP1]|uniref:Uroporphyrinogen decarboxylase n=1 Tax=Candidatus Segetimicrobium genomatis TaxID=2569760 RepID=A0A537L838_9BACT|nr:MAG: uroporphyrinogen decarboxylase [Terrabacteria group bacterium ANGP1]